MTLNVAMSRPNLRGAYSVGLISESEDLVAECGRGYPIAACHVLWEAETIANLPLWDEALSTGILWKAESERPTSQRRQYRCAYSVAK